MCRSAEEQVKPKPGCGDDAPGPNRGKPRPPRPMFMFGKCGQCFGAGRVTSSAGWIEDAEVETLLRTGTREAGTRGAGGAGRRSGPVGQVLCARQEADGFDRRSPCVGRRVAGIGRRGPVCLTMTEMGAVGSSR